MDPTRPLRGDSWLGASRPPARARTRVLHAPKLLAGAAASLRQRADFLVKLLVLALVVAAALGSVGFAYQSMVQRPRVLMVGDLFATQFESTLAALDAMSPAQRTTYLDDLARTSAGRIVADDPNHWNLGEPGPSLAREFLQELRTRLPGRNVAFSARPVPSLWLSVDVGEDRPRWLRVELPGLFELPLDFMVAAAILALALAGLGAGYLALRLQRRLAWLNDALDGVDARSGSVSSLPPHPRVLDPMDLDRHFSEMATRLAEAHAERALMMSRISQELQQLLQRLRQCQARDGPGEAARCIAEMEHVVGQFRDFSQTTRAEPTQALELNELLAELVLQRRDGRQAITMELGGLPFAELRPSAARRIFGNLLENALRHGAAPVEVTSALESGWLVVRVVDHGPGVSQEELALLARPFYRTDAARASGPGSGLGLAIARQEVEAHGGSLRLARAPAGGLLVEVCLPPARLG